MTRSHWERIENCSSVSEEYSVIAKWFERLKFLQEQLKSQAPVLQLE